MEMLYIPELEQTSQIIRISDDEFRHARALRLKLGSSIAITNGRGLSALTTLIDESKNIYTARIDNFFVNDSEFTHHHIMIGFGILDNKDRMEFLVEKAVELGVHEIFPLSTQFVQRPNISLNRLTMKAISAMKQSKRSILPIIHKLQTIDECVTQAKADVVIVGDQFGSKQHVIEPASRILILIGPEGGFSPKEQVSISHIQQLQMWSITPSRLRAETASIALLSVVASQCR